MRKKKAYEIILLSICLCTLSLWDHFAVYMSVDTFLVRSPCCLYVCVHFPCEITLLCTCLCTLSLWDHLAVCMSVYTFLTDHLALCVSLYTFLTSSSCCLCFPPFLVFCTARVVWKEIRRLIILRNSSLQIWNVWSCFMQLILVL
jgi:hypothetical protein